MASETTKTAAAGTFISRGEDCIQFKNSAGDVLLYIDSDGVLYPKGVGYKDGSYQVSAPSTTTTVIDSGTF